MNQPLTPERVELLLGGFATGTLTPEEHAALMDAAMADQRLFDALMDEEALRDALADPQTRDELIRALAPPASRSRFWRAPWPWAALATAAAAVAVFVLLRPQPPRDIATSAPAAPQQIAQNLPRVEPQPVEIPVPSKLTLQPEADFAKTKDLAETENRPAAKPALPASVPVPPAAAPPPAEFRQKLGDDKAARPLAAPAQPVAQEAVAAGVATGQVESKKEKADTPLAIALAFQQPDGTWAVLDPGAAAPAGRSLRLRVTSDRNGILSFTPPLAPPAPVQAGEPLTVILPGRQAGELAFRISLAPPLGAAASGEAGVFKSRAVASDAAAANLAAGAPARRDSAILTRDVKLKIE